MKANKLWKTLPEDLQNLLGSMLSMDPDERPSIDQILQSDWLYDKEEWNSAHMIFLEMEERFNFWKERQTKYNIWRQLQNN